MKEAEKLSMEFCGEVDSNSVADTTTAINDLESCLRSFSNAERILTVVHDFTLEYSCFDRKSEPDHVATRKPPEPFSHTQ